MTCNDTGLALKIVVGGEGGVGKTTILYRYINGKFLDNTQMTIGVQLQTAAIKRNNIKAKMIFWDLSGQERFRFILPTYCAGSLGAFIVFDMHADETLEAAGKWRSVFNGNLPHNAPVILVGTKMDLVAPDKLPSVIESANVVVKQHGFLMFIPTSSKTGENVDAAVETMFDAITASLRVPATF